MTLVTTSINLSHSSSTISATFPSTITLSNGSVPEYLSRIRPLPFNLSSELVIAFCIALTDSMGGLSLTTTFL